jgi:hypothetical protein
MMDFGFHRPDLREAPVAGIPRPAETNDNQQTVVRSHRRESFGLGAGEDFETE